MPACCCTWCWLQEALFQMQLAQIKEAAKRCTGLVGGDNKGIAGELPLTEEQVAAAKAARAEALCRHQQQQQEQDTHRCAAVLDHRC
jgi:hypothetical protein